MGRLLLLIFATLLVFDASTPTRSAAGHSILLIQVGTIPLDGVQGRIDHFGFDWTRQRLFVAALGNDTVEVIDLRVGRVIQQIKNLRSPQGIGFDAESNRLAVADDGDGSVRLYDGTSLQQTARVYLKDDADNVRYDSSSHHFWVGYGEGGLAEIDPKNGSKISDVKLESHPESFQLETRGTRIFVNLPSAGYVGVVDRQAGKITTRFTLRGARANFPMALDEVDKRLFIGCRSPEKLLVLDTDTGTTVAGLDIVGDSDDLFYDAANKRIYVSGGEGIITVIEQTTADLYEVLGQVATAPGARTSFFVPQMQTLYAAVSHRGEHEAEIRIFKVQPSRD
jgi:DNA-binding beta-propeller fold protein YncE